MKPTLIAVVCLLAGSAACVAAGDTALQFKKEVAASRKADESLAAAVLDADVFSATQPGLADLRLLDVRNNTVPFVLRKPQQLQPQEVKRRTWTAATPVLRLGDDGRLEITVQLDATDPHPDGFRLISPLDNFEHRVSTLTSADGQAWEPAREDAVIFDYSRHMDVRNDSVTLPASARKHLRIVIDKVTSQQQSDLLELTRRLRGDKETERTERIMVDRRPFRIERIEFWKDEVIKGDRKQSYFVAGYEVTEDPKTGQTIVTIQSRREPLTRFQLETTSRNFSRHCVVEVQEQHGVQKSWQQIGAGTLSRMDLQNLKREELSVSFPESRQPLFRLRIDNRDSPPLKVTGVSAEGNVYELVFLSSGQEPHQLHYGDPEAPTPRYDTAAIQSLLESGATPEPVSLGLEQRLAVPPAGFPVSRFFNDPRLMIGIIALLVVVLGWGLFAAAKRIDVLQSPPPAGSTPPEATPPPADSPPTDSK